jgi:hypothetical protein
MSMETRRKENRSLSGEPHISAGSRSITTSAAGGRPNSRRMRAQSIPPGPSGLPPRPEVFEESEDLRAAGFGLDEGAGAAVAQRKDDLVAPAPGVIPHDLSEFDLVWTRRSPSLLTSLEFRAGHSGGAAAREMPPSLEPLRSSA